MRPLWTTSKLLFSQPTSYGLFQLRLFRTRRARRQAWTGGMMKRGLAAWRDFCVGTRWSYPIECSFLSWWGGAKWIHERARSIQKRDAQCRNLSMQGSVRNARIQSRRFPQPQKHHERPWNCAVGGKGMWVSIEMGHGREKRFIDEAVRPHTAGGGTLRA